jgi:rhodanese-related sulfurtransferase
VKLNVIPTMLTMIPAVLRGVDTDDLATIKIIARRAYPAVTQLDLKTLASWMETRESLLLVDVRSPEEFVVSHLRGAVNLRSVDEIMDAVHERRPSATVLYCAVGFRSSRLAHKLTKRQVSGISNLEGSIFQWANEGWPLYRSETLVHQVHPYGKRWAGLLKRGLAFVS